jgi:radical SAM superfamily enzyme YgiQ (UPF0313 family)
VRTPDGIVKNNGRPLIQNLDDIPDPDYGIYDVDNLYHVKRGLFPYLMSRGCSFKCTYCSIPAMMEMSGERESSFWRFLSPERAVGQMRALMDAHMPYAERVHFLDAIFFSSKNWLKEFAVLYKEQIGLPFSCNLRADYVTKTTTAILKDMGCDDEMNARVLLRGLSIDKIRRAFDMLAAAGIQRVSYNLVGLPEENLALSLKTVRLNAELEPDIAIPFIFYPYPGTALYEKCKQEGYLTDREYDNYFIGGHPLRASLLPSHHGALSGGKGPPLAAGPLVDGHRGCGASQPSVSARPLGALARSVQGAAAIHRRAPRPPLAAPLPPAGRHGPGVTRSTPCASTNSQQRSSRPRRHASP